MRAGELAADLRDLSGGLAVSEDDLGKPDPAQAIEVEREIRGHAADLIWAREIGNGAGKRETENGRRKIALRSQPSLAFIARRAYRPSSSSSLIFVWRWPGLFMVTVSDRERFFVEARKTDDGDAAGIVEEV